MARSRFVALLLASALFLQAQSSTFPPYFTITDLGVLPGMQSITATGISSSGIVSGYSSPAVSGAEGLKGKGFLYSNGVLTALEKSGDAFTVPMAVNAFGTAVGLTGDNASSRLTPFVYRNGQFQIPVNLPYDASSASITLLAGINDSGAIVGNTVPSHLGGSNTQPFLFLDGAATTLPFAFATGVASNGDVSGWSGPGAGNKNLAAIYWDGRTAFTNACPPASACFAPNQGLAVTAGHSVTAEYGPGSSIPRWGCEMPAFALGSGIASAWCGAGGNVFTAINSQQWIVGMNVADGSLSSLGPGVSGDLFSMADGDVPGTLFAWPFSKVFAPGNSYGPFLTISPSPLDPRLTAVGAQLEELVVNGDGWRLSYVAAINDAGQIAGTGFHNGQQRAFLLNPGATPPTAPSIYRITGGALSVPSVTSIATGGWFSVFGFNFRPPAFLFDELALPSRRVQNNQLPVNVGQVCVEVNGIRAPLSFASSTQINVQAPGLPPGGIANVRVVANCDTGTETFSAPMAVPVASAAPEFLYFQNREVGLNPVAAVSAQTGHPVGIRGAPVSAGDSLTIFAVGLGPTTPPQVPGAIATAAAGVDGSVSVTFGGIDAAISYAGISPGSSGLYQINLTVPKGVASGNQPVGMRVNGLTSPTGAYLAIQ